MACDPGIGSEQLIASCVTSLMRAKNQEYPGIARSNAWDYLKLELQLVPANAQCLRSYKGIQRKKERKKTM
eukprot:358263-Pelagomonas_calceolata.AAC.1